MEQYAVTGMSCAACQTRVEKAVSGVSGVTFCTVNLLTNSMGVEGTAAAADIIKAVTDAGYGASEMRKDAGSKESGYTAQEEALYDSMTPVLKKRLLASCVFLAVLLYFSMGHVMWNWPLPAFFNQNHVAMGMVQMFLAILIMVINQKFFISGFKSMIHGAPNMDTLVALGSGASFIYSFFALLMMTDAQVAGNSEMVMHYMHEFYFESAAMIVTLITVGKLLESISKGKTTSALKGLMKLAPKTAVLLRGNTEITVPVEQVKSGDIFVVKPGESIPVDAVVLEGSSAVNESALTGESIPVDKTTDDTVSAATMNQSGFLKCRATRVGEDTTLSQIIRMVSDAAATKAPIARIADRVSAVFVPTVIVLSALTILIWLLVGADFGYALARGIAVLVISCPCALGLATPVAIMVGNGMGAKNGIMFKTSASLEEAGKTQVVIFDKTGTITGGQPNVTEMMAAPGVSEMELLQNAYSLEVKSEHPLARAIVTYAENQSLTADNLQDFTVFPGTGLEGMTAAGEVLRAGNEAFISSKVPISMQLGNIAQKLASEGKTTLFFAKDGLLLGIIAVSDVIRPESTQAINQLHHMGIRTVMLTGDNQRTAEAIARQAGVDHIVAGVMPSEKEKVIQQLKTRYLVMMVGDGINDAPALTTADIGVAIGAGTDIAIDAADVVLMKNSLLDVPAAIRLSRKTLINIYENLFWAFIYNIIGIPLAAGVYIHAFGWTLSPMFGAAAMSLSSFCVVSNALRLNLFQMYRTNSDKAMKKRTADSADLIKLLPKQGVAKEKIKERDKMNQKTLKIEGMMCGHCEATVKTALEEIPGVSQAQVSHEKGTAVVTLTAEVTDTVLKTAVEAKDYKVISIG
ncbi:MAG: heavy metal translocating P-type ATPase [Butyrivibrio sp.]|nr:heavy metal translocating P-type ATPase [Butyrivibrio sp.]